MGIENICASLASKSNRELDAQVANFPGRPLTKEYPFLWVAALCQKVWLEGLVVRMVRSCTIDDLLFHRILGRPRELVKSHPEGQGRRVLGRVLRADSPNG